MDHPAWLGGVLTICLMTVDMNQCAVRVSVLTIPGNRDVCLASGDMW